MVSLSVPEIHKGASKVPATVKIETNKGLPLEIEIAGDVPSLNDAVKLMSLYRGRLSSMGAAERAQTKRRDYACKMEAAGECMAILNALQHFVKPDTKEAE